MTEIVTVTQGEKHVSKPCPLPGGGAPASPQIFGTPYTYAQDVWPRATKFVW